MLDALRLTNEDTQPYININGTPLTPVQAKELRVQLYFMKLKHVPVTPDMFNQELQQKEREKLDLCRALVDYVMKEYH
jgi:hemoglobin-like flavoprotein